MAKQRPRARKRAPQTSARKPSTALVRQSRRAELVRAATDLSTLAAITPGTMALASDPVMSASFIGTLTLGEPQIKALRRPVEYAEIEWKAAVKDGPPVIPYLSHNGYRDRLDAAFGLGGWGMVPVGSPKEKDGFIFTPYALVIGGVPRVYAWGEQALHKMTYGDALEGAKSNAIVRCGKELGIARELWNRAYIAKLPRPRGAGQAPESRSVNETGTSSRPPATSSHRASGEPISKPQQRRLFVITQNSGRGVEEVSAWLRRRFGYTSSEQIKRNEYDTICQWIESPADLPEKG